MGGGNIGDASISISADLTDFIKSLGQAEAVFQKFADALAKVNTKSLEGLSKPIDEMISSLQDLKAAAEKIEIPVEVSPEAPSRLDRVTEAANKAGRGGKEVGKALKDIGDEAQKGGKRAEEAIEKIGQTAEKNQKRISDATGKAFLEDASHNLVKVGVEEKKLSAISAQTAQEVKKLYAEAKILAEVFGKAAAPAIGEVEKKLDAIRTKTGVALPEVSFDKFSAGAEQAGKSGGFLQNIIGNLNNRLQEMGLSVSGISVLLGAGFAGGLAGIIKIVIDLTGAIIRFVAEVAEANRQAALTFGTASEKVTQFADSADASLGRTRQELLTTATAFGQFGRSIDLPEDALADFATTLTTVASELERRRGGFKNLEEAQKTLEEALGGSDEALRKLGISLGEFRDTAVEAFGKLPDGLTSAERAFAGVQAASNEAMDAIINDGERAHSVLRSIGQGTSAVGAAFADLFTDEQREVWERVLLAISQLQEGISQSAFIAEGDFKKLTLAQLEFLRAQAALEPSTKKIVGIIDAEIAVRRKAAAEVEKMTQELLKQIDVQKLNEEAFLASRDSIKQVEDAFRSLARARVDGERNIQRAEEDRQRAVEDNARRERDVRLDIVRAAEDAARDIARAEEDLLTSREERVLKLKQAEEDLAQAKVEVFRSNRSAQEALEDFERESSRRIFDLKLRLKRAREQEARDIISALISVEHALRKGDVFAERSAKLALSRLKTNQSSRSSLEDTERELDRAREDRKLKLGRLERTIEETRLDGIKKLQKAERDLERVQLEVLKNVRDAQRRLEDGQRDARRANEDAINSLHDLEVENTRALRDAALRLRDAQREAKRAIADATRSLERMAITLGITVERLRELLDLWRSGFGQGVGETPIPIGGIKFQHGGPIQAGTLGIVGERGPELFIPNTSGTVISNDRLEQVLRQLAGRETGTSQSITVVDSGDPEATAFMVAHRLMTGVNN